MARSVSAVAADLCGLFLDQLALGDGSPQGLEGGLLLLKGLPQLLDGAVGIVGEGSDAGGNGAGLAVGEADGIGGGGEIGRG